MFGGSDRGHYLSCNDSLIATPLRTTDALEAVIEVVNQIPEGTVMSYGRVGRLVGCTGRQVGKIMGWLEDRVRVGDQSVAWWRVVAANGDLPIAKRDPRLAQEQRHRLCAEGVQFLDSGKVNMATFQWEA